MIFADKHTKAILYLTQDYCTIAAWPEGVESPDFDSVGSGAL